AAVRYLARLYIHVEICHVVVFRSNSRTAARERPDPRRQLHECKRLREIVIRAGFQPAHAVLDGVTSSEHQDRRRYPALPKDAAQVEARATRQEHVQHDDVEGAQQGPLATRREILRRVDLYVMVVQAVADDGRKLWIIFYEKDTHVISAAVRPTECRRGRPDFHLYYNGAFPTIPEPRLNHPYSPPENADNARYPSTADDVIRGRAHVPRRGGRVRRHGSRTTRQGHGKGRQIRSRSHSA